MRITGCLLVVAVQADIRNKLLLGYQGWFGAPGDGSEDNKWRHWSSGTPTGKTLTVDMHPDLSRGFKCIKVALFHQPIRDRALILNL